MDSKEIIEVLSYTFMKNAVIVGILISICAALLGVVLVLKRYSLIGHGLADVGFASMSLALAVGVNPVYVSIPVVIICSFLIMYLSQSKKVHGDIAIGVFSTGSMAIGVLAVSLNKGNNTDVYSYMFGSILALNNLDLIFSIGISVIILGLFVVFYNRLFLITVDESFAEASGINVNLYRFLISFLTALIVVIGMRMMGTLLISSLIIFPAIIAKKFAGSFRSLMVISAIISVFCFIVGLLFSLLIDIPIGASIVLINIAVLMLSKLRH